MQPTIIIDETGDVDMFESVVEAEQYLEPIDVKHGRLKLMTAKDGSCC